MLYAIPMVAIEWNTENSGKEEVVRGEDRDGAVVESRDTDIIIKQSPMRRQFKDPHLMMLKPG